MHNLIRLSPTSLNLFKECPRCFWLYVNKKVKPPEKFPPVMQLGIDLALKAYYDHFRGKRDLPPMLEGELKGRLLPDQALVDRFRSDGFGFEDEELGIWFGGKLDDVLELSDGSIIPIDNKSHGFPPKEAHEFHIYQLSGYTLMLIKNGFKTKNFGYLIHYFLDHRNLDMGNPLCQHLAVEEVKTEPTLIEQFLSEAVELLRGSMPKHDPDCIVCKYKELDFSKL